MHVYVCIHEVFLHLITATLLSSTGTFPSCIYCHQKLSCDSGHGAALVLSGAQQYCWWKLVILHLFRHFKPRCKETPWCSKHFEVPCHLHLVGLPLQRCISSLDRPAVQVTDVSHGAVTNYFCLGVPEFSLIFRART